MARIAFVDSRWVITCDQHDPAYTWEDAGTPAGRERIVGTWELHDVWRHGGANELVEVNQ